MPLRASRYLAVLALPLLFLFSSCGGSSSSTPTQPPPAQTPTVTLTADTSSVTSGGSVTLTWSSKNATSVTISPSILTSGQSSLPLSGSQQVKLTQKTTFTATAKGDGGTSSPAAVTVDVTSAAPTLTFSVDKSTVTAGDLVTLTWATTNASTFTISPSVLGEDQTSLALSGSTTVVVSANVTYTATASGAGGNLTKTVAITANPAAPTALFSATPSTINIGDSAQLSWTTTNATSVSIDNGVGTGLGANSTANVTPSATTTYTLTATGAGGTATATTTVTVMPKVSVILTASPTTISTGQTSTLSWTSTGVANVTLDNGLGVQSAEGSVSVSPSATTTYTASVDDGAGHTGTSQATVTVQAPGTGSLSSIKHIFFMLQENRTFDSYFGKLGAYRVAHLPGALASDVNDLDSLPSGFGLKTRADAPHPNFVVPPFHQRTLQTENLSPSWNESHYDAHIQGTDYLNVGPSTTFKMDNFLQTTHSVSPDRYDPDGSRPMGYYDETDFPYYYELATQFATSDAFHSSLLSQTNPNRMYLFAATSIGRCNADPGGHPLWDTPTIFDNLQSHSVSWRYYYQDGVFLSQFASWNDPNIQGHVYPISNMFTVLADPKADQNLPSVIFIEKGDATDEHPDNNVQQGAAYVKQVLDAVMASPVWKDSIFILAYDEGGGLFDHVPPFQVTPPDTIAPNCPKLTQAKFDLSGFRVPIVAISPYSKPHYVSHTPMETTSILKLIETRFNLPPLTQRDANAPDMQEFFDFTTPAWLTPPSLPDQPNECLTNAARCSQNLETYPGLPQ